MWPFLFFFNDTATTEIYTLSLHDALPISQPIAQFLAAFPANLLFPIVISAIVLHKLNPDIWIELVERSEEHTSELQSRSDLVCRLLLEKTKAASAVSPREPQT